MRREVSKNSATELNGRSKRLENSEDINSNNYERNNSNKSSRTSIIDMKANSEYERGLKNSKKDSSKDLLFSVYSNNKNHLKNGVDNSLHHLHNSHGSHRSNNDSNFQNNERNNKEKLHHTQTHQQTHHHQDGHEILTMLIDGVGLAMVAGATLLEGVVLWKAFFHEYWDTHTLSLAFWFLGRFCQVFGLMLLIAFAASFDTLTAVEYAGMTLITIGPIFNTIASLLFDAKNDPLFLFNKAWRTNEFIEFCGMLILDISYVEMSDIMVLLTEWLGFCTLICAATVEFEYFPTTPIPNYEVRYDLVHSGEAVGLMFLMLVAYIQYRERIETPKTQQTNNISNGTASSKQVMSNSQLHHRRSVSPQGSNEVIIV